MSWHVPCQPYRREPSSRSVRVHPIQKNCPAVQNVQRWTCWGGWWLPTSFAGPTSLQPLWEPCLAYPLSWRGSFAVACGAPSQLQSRVRLPPLSAYFPPHPDRYIPDNTIALDHQECTTDEPDVQSATSTETVVPLETLEWPQTTASTAATTTVTKSPLCIPGRDATADDSRSDAHCVRGHDARSDGRQCYHCGVSKSPNWYLMENDRTRRLCNACGKYWKRTGAQRPAHLVQCSQRIPRRRGRAPTSVRERQIRGALGSVPRKLQAMPFVGSPLTPPSTSEGDAPNALSKVSQNTHAARPLLPSFERAADPSSRGANDGEM